MMKLNQEFLWWFKATNAFRWFEGIGTENVSSLHIKFILNLKILWTKSWKPNSYLIYIFPLLCSYNRTMDNNMKERLLSLEAEGATDLTEESGKSRRRHGGLHFLKFYLEFHLMEHWLWHIHLLVTLVNLISLHMHFHKPSLYVWPMGYWYALSCTSCSFHQ